MLFLREDIEKKLKEELEKVKGSDLEKGLKHAITIFSKEKQKDNMKAISSTVLNDEFREFLNKEVYIDSTAYYGDRIVFKIGQSTYRDKCGNRYEFESTSDNHMNLGCINSRRREKVLFLKEDVEKLFNAKLEEYIKKNKSKWKLSDNLNDCVNKNVLILDYAKGNHISVYTGTVLENTMLKPLKILSEYTQYDVLEKNCDLSKLKDESGLRLLYAFNKEDLSELIKVIKDLIA
ncbi:hypothetical protein ACV3UL_14350 [Clostridium perfringens]